MLCVTTLDELPQLINVLRGDMGPIRRREVRRDRMDASEWIAGETTTIEQARRRVERDLDRIENLSLTFDLLILGRTVFAALSHANAN